MKTLTQLTQSVGIRTVFLAIIAFCGSLLTSITVFAQSVPEKVDVDINTGGDTMWYGQPWVWAIGVAIFVVVIIAITRSGNKTTD